MIEQIGLRCRRLTVDASTDAVCDREWLTALVIDYTAHTPALKNSVVIEAVARHRQIRKTS